MTDWRHEIPKYRVMIDLDPPPRTRYRLEKPFTEMTDPHCFQYAERPLKAGEVVELKSWPHETMFPLNEAARRTLTFFRSAMKSRLSVSPWQNGRLVLDDGLSGPSQPFVRPPAPVMPKVA